MRCTEEKNGLSMFGDISERLITSSVYESLLPVRCLIQEPDWTDYLFDHQTAVAVSHKDNISASLLENTNVNYAKAELCVVNTHLF